MRRRAYLAGAGSVGLASLAGCTALSDAAANLVGGPEYDIGMDRMAFTPDTYETMVGEPVVWRNTSGSVHTITAYEGGYPDGAEYFASGGYESETEAREAWKTEQGGAISTGATFELTFEIPGTYSYFCIPHEVDGSGEALMIGTITVTE